MKCAVPSCRKDFHSVLRPMHSKHRFPIKHNRRLQWIRSIVVAENDMLQQGINFETARICSDHFTPESFKELETKRTLRNTAVPTLFGSDVAKVGNSTALASSIASTVPPTEYEMHLKSIQNPVVPSLQSRSTGTVRYIGDITTNTTGDQLVAAVPKIKSQFARNQHTIKLLRAQNRRLNDKMTSMEQLMSTLQKKQLVDDFENNPLQEYSTNNDIFVELKSRKNGNPYSESLRKFAITLHFYSPRAYNYVRKVFRNALPHSRTIYRWYVNVNGEPGVSGQALDALRVKAQEMLEQGKALHGCLLMDEMAIRQQVTWIKHSQRFDGTVNYGGITSQGENLTPAKEALVFMVSGVEEAWKVPIAYYLINGLKAEEKKNLVNTILCNLHEVGVKVVAFTFDGTKSNIATANALGCDLRTDSLNLKPRFSHPCGEYDVCVLLDVVHMIKLVRNTLHSQQTLLSRSGTVKWEYIEKLNEYQNDRGIKIAENLSDKHVHFENSKMKVILAVQTISGSVASALNFLSSYEADFTDSVHTAEFLQLFNNIFDILNSMRSDAQNFKKPLDEDNIHDIREVFAFAEGYIRSLKLLDGTLILKSMYKTGFLGFLVAMETFRYLYTEYCEMNKSMSVIYTYRFSQDHLEMFFGAIRSKSGSNNNPNAGQFRASYKRMLNQIEISSSSYGNCTDFNTTPLLQCCDIIPDTRPDTPDMDSNQPLQETASLETENKWELFRNDDITHFAIKTNIEQLGKQIALKIICEQCIEVISNVDTLLLICKAAEFEFRNLVGTDKNVNVGLHFDNMVIHSVARSAANLDFLLPCDDDHQLHMLQLVSEKYLHTRTAVYSKQIIPFKPSNRQKLTKIIIFEGH